MNYSRQERLVTVDGLNLSFNGKTVLRNINLVVDNLSRPGLSQGQVVALLGPSGIGKTQLFKCMAGLQEPTAGTVTLNGSRAPVCAGDVGVVFQNYPLLNHRTIEGNLKLAARKRAGGAAEIERMLVQFELADKKHLYPAELSGGQRQRVAIIQQLLCSEHFILMDEPFSGLDIVMKKKVANTITKVSTSHELNTVILTTHDVSSAVMLADTIWVLGRQRDAAGAMIPGATVINQLDMIERGLAWNAEVEHHPNFAPTVAELKTLLESA